MLVFSPQRASARTADAHARCAPPVAATDFSDLRRRLLAPAVFSLLGGRVLWLAASKEDVALPAGEPRFDEHAASKAVRQASACAVQSCYDASLKEQAFYLDTTAEEKNQRGKPEERLPVVYIEPAFGSSRASLANYRVVMTVPPPARSADVRLMWLKNAATGQVLASKSFDTDGRRVDTAPVPTIIATLLEPYGGVARSSEVVPYVYYARDGLWEGAPITLCAPSDGQSSCSSIGALGPADFRIDARARRDRSEVGLELLRKAGLV